MSSRFHGKLASVYEVGAIHDRLEYDRAQDETIPLKRTSENSNPDDSVTGISFRISDFGVVKFESE